MAGYLDTYGVGVEQRIRKIKIIVVSLIALVIAGGTLFYVFHNFREEQQVKQFFAALSRKDYKTAYAMFGCTETKPCSAYGLDRFMEDWGPASGHDPSQVRILRSRTCGTGVILNLDYGHGRQDSLWVERKNMTIGFPPFGDVCPSGLAGR